MLETTVEKTNQLDQETLTQSESDMDFTLADYHQERINHHMKMLSYYLTEQTNEELDN